MKQIKIAYISFSLGAAMKNIVEDWGFYLN
jgi:hypothetical protein